MGGESDENVELIMTTMMMIDDGHFQVMLKSE